MSSKFENIFRINRKLLFATLGGFETSAAFFLGYTYIRSTVDSYPEIAGFETHTIHFVFLQFYKFTSRLSKQSDSLRVSFIHNPLAGPGVFLYRYFKKEIAMKG